MARALVKLALVAVCAVVGLAGGREARAAEVLKIGTLAPEQSPWGQVFSVWAKAVNKKTDGRLEMHFFWNGQQGDEGAMVGKIKAGQLDAAGVTSVGLSKIHRPILAMQTPGLFRTWEKLDAARDAMKAELEKGIKQNGFVLTGWGDVGQVRGMSKGFAVRRPNDLIGKRPMTWRDDSIGPVVYQLIGVNPVPLNIPEVLPSLGTGAINVLSAPALAAEQLQWASRLDHVSSESSVMAIGAMVWSEKRLDALPGDLRTVLKDTGAIASKALTKRIRKEDAEAYGRLKKTMTVVTLTESEKKEWADLFQRAGERLTQGTFSPELMKRLVELSK